MFKKTISILVILTLLLTIQPILADNSTEEFESYLLIRGWIYNPQIKNNTVNSKVIRLRYSFLNVTDERFVTGVVRFTNVSFKDIFIKIPYGKTTYIFGFGKTYFNIY